MFDRAKEKGTTFNPDKFQFQQEKIKLLGFVVSKEGTAIDPGRIEAITKMPIPENKKDLLRFLGLVNIVGKYIPNLADITFHLENS